MPTFGKRKLSVCRNRTNQQSTSSSGATPPQFFKQGTLNVLTTSGSKQHEIDLQLIAKCEQEFQIKVTSVVTDNTANMASMRDQIKCSENLLHCYGCKAHNANLLAKDIVSDYKAVITKNVAVLKILPNRHLQSSMLREKNVPRPLLPMETR